MSEDFNISQKETGFPLLKWGNFAPVYKLSRLAYLRGARAAHTSYVILYYSQKKWEKSVYYAMIELLGQFFI